MHIKQQGYSIVELLIGITMSLILFTALIAVFSTNLGYSSKSLKIDKLNSELQSALMLMSNEIRRAGYWANASSDLAASSNHNPFMSTTNGTDISVPNSSCILFTYDKNADGTLPAISSASDDERYGFRLNSQVLQTRPYGASFSCAAAASAWENVTDSNVVLITNLSFTLNQTTVSSSGTTSLLIRSVDISITGQLANDSTITKTLTQHVRIRNDRFTPP